MAHPFSLMEFLQALSADAQLRDSFGNDPGGTLAAHGLADLTPADVHDAIVLIQDNQTFDFNSGSAPQPPPLVGDDHEAAVEYLARYLDHPGATDDGTDFGAGAADEPAGHEGDDEIGPEVDDTGFTTGDTLGTYEEHEPEPDVADDLEDPQPLDPGADLPV